MTNEEIVREIQDGRNVRENEGLLYEQNRKFLKKRAGRWKAFDDPEDLEQVAALGLLAAIPKYDPSRGAKFLTAAGYYIDEALRRHCLASGYGVSVPKYLFTSLYQLDLARREIYARTGKAATAEQIALELHAEPSEIYRLLKCELRVAKAAALDKPIDEDGNTLADTIAAPGSMEDEIIEREATAARNRTLWECVDDLPEDLRRTVLEIFRDGSNISALADRRGCSRTKVREELLRSFGRIRRNQRLQPYLPEMRNEYLQTKALHGTLAGFMTHGSVTERLAIRSYSGMVDAMIQQELEECGY